MDAKKINSLMEAKWKFYNEEIDPIRLNSKTKIAQRPLNKIKKKKCD